MNAGSIHPYYQRVAPRAHNAGLFSSDTTHIDLTQVHLPAYGISNTVSEAVRLFDSRAAAAIADTAGLFRTIHVFPSAYTPDDLLELKSYGNQAPGIYIPKVKSLAAMAYPDYFPGASAEYLWRLVSDAILKASPGWCGTFGPGVDAATDLL